MSDDHIILGDAADVQAGEYTPRLTGVGEGSVVTVFNPLPHDFRVVFSRPAAYHPVDEPNRKFAADKGLNLNKNTPREYVTQDVILPAVSLKNLPGDIAQIAVRKLITTIIQTRNDDGSWQFDGHGTNKGMVPDPFRRQQIEAEIIKGVYSATEFFNRDTAKVTTAEATASQISAMNDPTNPGGSNNGTSGTGSDDTPAAVVPGGPGKPSPAEPSFARPAGHQAKS